MSIFRRMEELGLQRIEILPNSPGVKEAEWVAEIMRQEGHERVIVINRPKINLKAAIAIHDRTLGEQALGGCRLLPYSTEEEMFIDVLRLSKAMTYKSAMAGLSRGGAKCVIWAKPRDKTFSMLLTLGEEIEALGGSYVTGEDMNIDERDILIMSHRTSYVAGLPETYRHGKHRGSGDPSPVTAKGIVYGMKACLKFLDMGGLEGKIIAIQGIGKVGFRLARFLYQEGVGQIIACDLNKERIRHFQEEFQGKALVEFRKSARVVSPDEIYAQQCDIFAPCAGGAALNSETIPLLRCKTVAGAANNQLADAKCGRLLMERNILYAPDYVINVGGLINVDEERHPDGYNESRVQRKLENIYPALLNIFVLSKILHRPAGEVADLLAEERIQLQKRFDALRKAWYSEQLGISLGQVSDIFTQAKTQLEAALGS